jgi:hypothetical protein
MTVPLPWSVSSLDAFGNCPKSYNERWVKKNFKEDKGEAQIWGGSVHKSFELRQSVGQALPMDLAEHEPFMRILEDKPGTLFTELKVNLDRKARPINDAFAPDIWFRGGIDWLKVDRESRSACIVDYKTGKKNDKWRQLAMYAIWTFLMFPECDLVNAKFYWTVDKTAPKKVWSRADIPMLWAMFLGDLRLYVEAFKGDHWPARPSGLCNGWCPVTTCSHWKPKRVFK